MKMVLLGEVLAFADNSSRQLNNVAGHGPCASSIVSTWAVSASALVSRNIDVSEGLQGSVGGPPSMMRLIDVPTVHDEI